MQPAPANGESSILHKVSIVVPVYCGELTLGKLIDEISPLTRPQYTPSENLFQIQKFVLVHDRGSRLVGFLRRFLPNLPSKIR
jgi:undecaprenyl-phosphate 4-deoxy-4-formamido-L-arabinose transferase